jgi:predicted nucleic acid-binding Zn ribbon protein
MERATKLIRGLKLSGETISDEQLVCAAWPVAVGRKIAAHARASRLVRTRLVIEVEDVIWRRQLMALGPQILSILERNLRRGLVEDLEFRVVPRRREPQRATSALPVMDEAETIADPVLRKLYKVSRKKAQA